MSRHEFDLMNGRVLGPLGVMLVFVVIVVIAQRNAADPSATPTTLDFSNRTSVTLAPTTTTSLTTPSAQAPTETPVVTAPTISCAAG